MRTFDLAMDPWSPAAKIKDLDHDDARFDWLDQWDETSSMGHIFENILMDEQKSPSFSPTSEEVGKSMEKLWGDSSTERLRKDQATMWLNNEDLTDSSGWNDVLAENNQASLSTIKSELSP